MIEKLLEKNPLKRLGCQKSSYSDIKKSSFFSGINWKEIKKRSVESKLINMTKEMSQVKNENDTDLKSKSDMIDCGSEFKEGIESDCSMTSFHVDDFTEDFMTNYTNIKV